MLTEILTQCARTLSVWVVDVYLNDCVWAYKSTCVCVLLCALVNVSMLVCVCMQLLWLGLFVCMWVCLLVWMLWVCACNCTCVRMYMFKCASVFVYMRTCGCVRACVSDTNWSVLQSQVCQRQTGRCLKCRKQSRLEEFWLQNTLPSCHSSCLLLSIFPSSSPSLFPVFFYHTFYIACFPCLLFFLLISFFTAPYGHLCDSVLLPAVGSASLTHTATQQHTQTTQWHLKLNAFEMCVSVCHIRSVLHLF